MFLLTVDDAEPSAPVQCRRLVPFDEEGNLSVEVWSAPALDDCEVTGFH